MGLAGVLATSDDSPILVGGLPPRWYVRGPDTGHDYDRAIKDGRRRGQSFCRTCEMFHVAPVGNEWHIESMDVDHMLCGIVVGLDEGEVRVRPGRNICPRCAAAAKKEDRR